MRHHDPYIYDTPRSASEASPLDVVGLFLAATVIAAFVAFVYMPLDYVLSYFGTSMSGCLGAIATGVGQACVWFIYAIDWIVHLVVPSWPVVPQPTPVAAIATIPIAMGLVFWAWVVKRIVRLVAQHRNKSNG